MTDYAPFPLIDLAGSPRERGRSHGKAAADRLRRGAKMYADSLLKSGVDWKELERRAEAMVPIIDKFGPAYVEEMRGIAEGAGEPFEPHGFVQSDNADYRELGLERVKDAPEIACAPAPRLCRAENGRFGTMRIEIESEAPTAVTLHRFFFPAWRLDNDLPLAASEPLKLVSFTAPAGRTSATLLRRALPAEQWGWAISGLSFLLLLGVTAFGARSTRFWRSLYNWIGPRRRGGV